MRPAAQADFRYGELFIGLCRLSFRRAFFGRKRWTARPAPLLRPVARALAAVLRRLLGQSPPSRRPTLVKWAPK